MKGTRFVSEDLNSDDSEYNFEHELYNDIQDIQNLDKCHKQSGKLEILLNALLTIHTATFLPFKTVYMYMSLLIAHQVKTSMCFSFT